MTAVFYGWWRGADGKVSAEVVVEKGRAPCGWEFLEVEGATNRVRLEWPIRGLEDSKDLAIGPTTIPRARSNLERTLA